ncbi:hypothetical protein [Roseateles flavus]|uniref:Uncharacterized protein n=1 Tax=Roseateles flavus TaxID=3149041 RepID=A0ABV0GB04_9BURK
MPLNPHRKARLRIVVLVLALLILLVWLGVLLTRRSSAEPDEVQAYRQSRPVSLPALDFRFDELSETWTEADLRRQFPQVQFDCGKVPPTSDLGEWGCGAEIFTHNGVEAMRVSFFFHDGHLDSASVNVPKWTHKKALHSVLALYGQPAGLQSPPSADGLRLVAWRLKDGSALFYNRDRPIAMPWSAMFWVSQSRCKQRGCIVDRAADGRSATPDLPDAASAIRP